MKIDNIPKVFIEHLQEIYLEKNRNLAIAVLVSFGAIVPVYSSFISSLGLIKGLIFGSLCIFFLFLVIFFLIKFLNKDKKVINLLIGNTDIKNEIIDGKEVDKFDEKTKLKITDSEELEKNYIKNSQNQNIQKLAGHRIGILFITLILLGLFLHFSFHYFVTPKIYITSPTSGEVVNINKDNPFLTIKGTSKGLVNNPFIHLFVLCKRTDSNEDSGLWMCEDHSFENSFTLYEDGNWEYRYPIYEIYSKLVSEADIDLYNESSASQEGKVGSRYVHRETCIVGSPSKPHNNVSTEVEIVAIVTKQTALKSIITKLENTDINPIYSTDSIDEIIYKLFKNISNLLLSTFSDEYYDIFDAYGSHSYYGSTSKGVNQTSFLVLPQHLSDSHVTIKPSIDNYNYNCDYENELHFRNEYVFRDIYKGDTIYNSVYACRDKYNEPIEGVNIFLDGVSLHEKTSESGDFNYTVNISGVHQLKASKEGFLDATTNIVVKEPEAKFEFSNLSIIPREIEYGKNITFTIDVLNRGNAKGNHEVRLLINGKTIDSQNISLEPGESTKVNFSHSDNKLGTYEIEIEGYQDSYKVIIPKIIIIGVICLVIISPILIYIISRYIKS